VFFFLASAFFQTVSVTVSTNKYILAPTIRYIEYSITAPLMTVAIALQIGIMHTHTLSMLAMFSWACMMARLCCEKTREAKSIVINKLKVIKDDISAMQLTKGNKVVNELRKVVFFTQTASWVMLGITFFILIDAFHASQNTCGSVNAPENAPEFIWAILYGELLFFVLISFMQILEMMGALSKQQAELSHIGLSLVSKIILGWLIYGANFVQA